MGNSLESGKKSKRDNMAASSAVMATDVRLM